MLRTLLAALPLLVSAGVSQADVLPLVGVPTEYTPGVAFSFDVTAPGLGGLSDYTIGFVVSTDSSSSHPDLSISAAPPAAGYPFPDDSNFNASIGSSLGLPGYFVTLTDASSGASVNTTAGVNDDLATVTISPGVNLSGPINIQFVQNDFTTARDVGFDLPAKFVITQSSGGPGPGPEPVPGPPAWLLLGLGGLCALARQRWRGAPQTAMAS